MKKIQEMKMFLFFFLLMLVSNEAVVNPTSPNIFIQQQQDQDNQTMNPVPMNIVSPVIMQEEKKIQSWKPSQPELTQMLQQPPLPAAMPYPAPMQSPQAFVPNNYYLPADDYGPPQTSEFRSEHYPYPFDPNYAYSVSPPSANSALVPTAKHFVIVSFIGLLLLFAIIQNSIAATKSKETLVEILSSRKKRDIITSANVETMNPDMESVLTEDARVRCIQRTLCYENRKLSEDLGILGKLLPDI